MAFTWYKEFLQRLREFKTHCADALVSSAFSKGEKINVQPISRAVDALERHWKKKVSQT